MDVLKATVSELVDKQLRREVTAVDIVKAHLSQIARYNEKLRAVIEVNPEALLIAEGLDKERNSGHLRGPLHGIPVLLKDNIDTGDMMHTSAGSIAMADHLAKRDATIVEKLRSAGAVILGKTNMTEWANFISNGMKNGFSSRGGQVQNPYGPGDFDVGGSSSGSGAAIAAGFAVAAIGTETSGSILSPSSSNSLVGIKPTLGLVSRDGIIPIAVSQDTAGPMARSVTDAAIVLSVIQGSDPRDVATAGTMLAPDDYHTSLQRNALRQSRLGVPRGYYHQGLSPAALAVFEQALRELVHAGAVLVDPIELPSPEENENLDVLIYEFKPALNNYLARAGCVSPRGSLYELIEFNRQHADVALRYGQDLFEAAETTSGTLTEPKYIWRRMRDLQWSRHEGIDLAIATHGLDALVFPSEYGAAIAAKAGYPSITVPAGYSETGQPIGLTFTGSGYSEARLISLAYAYEQATLHRREPSLE